MDIKSKKTKSKVFEVECPCCRSVLWIDFHSKEVIKFDKKRKERGNLDELLLKEKKRKAGFETRFESTAELARERQKNAQKRYKEAFTQIEKQNDES